LKIIHFADLHLGVETYSRFDPVTGLSQRLLDFLSTFDQLVDYALNNGVDLVLFCGDAYKSREPSQTQQREFAKRIDTLSKNGIQIFLLTGNHDLPNAIGKATAIEIFDTLSISNVHVANRPGIYTIKTKSGDIQILALPWLRRSTLLSKDDSKNLSMEQVNQKLQQALADTISINIPKLDPKLPSILAAHAWVSGAKTGSEKGMTLGQEHVLLLSSLTYPVLDYIALGHIHKHQVLNDSPPVVYSGSLDRLDFSDEEDEKGFYTIEIDTEPDKDKRNVIYNFHPINNRSFLTINLDIQSTDTDPTSTIIKAINTDRTNDAIVRLDISLPAEIEGQIKYSEIKDVLERAYHFSIIKDVKRDTRLRLGKGTAEKLTPIDALSTYLETKNLSQERTKVLLEYGERIIQGQD